MIALSRLTGFGRMMVTAKFYGISPVTDAYNAAFLIPDTLSILIAGGALATGFVPVFTGMLSRGEAAAAIRTFRAMWTLLLVVFTSITALLFALTYSPLSMLGAPAKVTPEVADLYLHLLRILLVAQGFFVLGGLFSGTLNAMRHFWYFALQPVAFNGGIILFGIVGPKYFGAGIESQAWGALFGAIVGSILIQVPAIYRHGLTLRPLWDLKDEGVRQVMGSLLPIVFGLASGQAIALLLPKFLATGAQPGDISALDYANRLLQVPLAVLASGPAIALFPTLSMLAAKNDTVQVREQLSSSLRRALTMNLLATALLVALAVPLIRVLLQRGAFTAEHTSLTALTLACYAPALVALSAQQFLSRGFYALRDTRTPTWIGLASMALFLVVGAAATRVSSQTAPALALASSLAIVVLAAWMGRALKHKLGAWDEGRTERVLAKGAVSALAGGVAAFGIVSVGPHASTWGALATLCVAGAAGSFVFVFAATALGLEEVEAVTQKLGKAAAKLSRGKRK
jgi:putative peptidoglycan lipid II flippase